MLDRYGRVCGSAIAVLLVVSCLFIGKVVAVDSPNSPVGILLRIAQGKQEPTEPFSASAQRTVSVADTDRAADAELQDSRAVEGPQLESNSVHAPELEQGVPDLRARLSPNGGLIGRITVVDSVSGVARPAERMTMALLQRGRVIAEFRPQADGVFDIPDLESGSYSLIGFGEDGYVAYGVELDDDRGVAIGDAPDANLVGSQEIEQQRDLDTFVVPAIDAPVVLRIARQHLSSELISSAASVGTEQAIDENPSVPAADEQVPLQDEQSDGLTVADVRQFEVRLADDGSLTGRLRSLDAQAREPHAFRSLNVYLVQNRAIVESTPVSPLGDFRFDSATPGVYSFVAAGENGFAAFSIRVLASSVASSGTPGELFVPVTFMAADFAGMLGTLVMAEDVTYAVSQLDAAFGGQGASGGSALSTPGAGSFGSSGFGGGGPTPGGSMATGGYGGGGGGFGGGGIGGVLGLAGLAAGIAVAASDSGGGGTRVIATPF